jgi:hypothetical protein
MFLPYVLLVGVVVFWPTLVIAIATLRSPSRAFALAGAFTLGSMTGAWLSLIAASPLFMERLGDTRTWLIFAFATLGAIAGGVIAVHLVGRIAGRSLWRRP